MVHALNAFFFLQCLYYHILHETTKISCGLNIKFVKKYEKHIYLKQNTCLVLIFGSQNMYLRGY